ncbi:hypothetical protein [Chryseobacterium indoltheticum]|uniref:hypothetical protein n=1 Tax=Chryseobacterium indoltheticum TaxID=254 RepID=UPI003F49AE87
MDVIKNLENIDRLETAEVNFTGLKQGIFNLQAKFWIAIGSNMLHIKSEALEKIKKRLDADNIPLVTPTSINLISQNSQDENLNTKTE